MKILFIFVTKQASLTSRLTALSLPLQLVFYSNCYAECRHAGCPGTLAKQEVSYYEEQHERDLENQNSGNFFS